MTCARLWLPTPGAETFHALAEAIDRCVFFKDRGNRYLLVNTAFRHWLGHPDAEVVGRTVFDVWPPAVAEALADDDRRVLAGERVEKEEQRPNAHELRTLKTVKIPVADPHGRVVGILGYFADVTDDRHRDEECRQAQRLAMMGRLTAGLTHDLNHLLTLAQGNASLLASGVPADAPEHVLAERIETAVSRAAQLTHRLIAFARADQPVHETADVNAALDEITGLFRAVLDRRITLHVWPGLGLPRVRVPLSQLTQIVLNLCLNAHDAMPEGGRLALQTDLASCDRLATDRRPDGPRHGRCIGAYVALRVSDTGVGMTPAVKARVFDPWYTTKSNGNGSGLGLTIVQEVARRHGGWVECSSTVGRGTCFAVYLPAADAEPAPATLPLNLAVPPVPTVLLADNDACIVSLCRTILESGGYRVYQAADGKEATALYRQERGRIGLVLLDQDMPGMSGGDVLAELAAADPAVRVVFISGAPPEGVPPELARNVRGFLPKPFHAMEMLDTVRRALAGE